MPYKDPEKRHASVREAVARHKAAAGGKPKTKPSPLPGLAELRFKTARDVLALVNGQVEALLAAPALHVVTRARCVGYLAALLMRAVEVGEIETRLEALEAAINGGTNGETTRRTPAAN